MVFTQAGQMQWLFSKNSNTGLLYQAHLNQNDMCYLQVSKQCGRTDGILLPSLRKYPHVSHNIMMTLQADNSY